MKDDKNNEKLDELILETIGREKPKFEFDKWKQSHQKEIEIYESQTAGQKVSHSVRVFEIGRSIMKSRVNKIAAAVIILAILGLHQLNSSIKGTSIVWADVAERLEKMNSFKAKTSRTFDGVVKDETLEFDVIRYFSPEYGYVDEQYADGELGMMVYGLFSEKVLIIVLPKNKQYFRFELNEEFLSMMEYINPVNPDGIIKLFGSDRCTKLGKRKIKGVDAEGFEVRDIKVFSGIPRILFKLENIDLRIWVNPNTLLPIEIEAETLVEKGLLTRFKNYAIKEIVYDIEYDAEIDESIFDPNIPDDYILIDPSDLVEKAEATMLGIIPFGAAIMIYRHRKST